MTQPMLVLGRRDNPHRFAAYLREILATEGVVSWQYHDLADAVPDLAAWGLILLEHADLEDAWITALQAYVHEGGRLIAMRPSPELARAMGLQPVRSSIRTACDLYITFNEDEPLGACPHAPSIQFRGLLDLYQPGAYQGLAFLGGQLGIRTQFPAIALCRHGAGMVAIFAFDLADCVVQLHQGSPLNASDGPNPDPNADGAYKPDDFFYGHLDERLKNVPQADVHCRMLTRLMDHLSAVPMLRLWRFPDAAPAVALLDGDSDSMSCEQIEQAFTIIGRHGGRFTIYLMPEQYETISPERMAELRTQGHDAGPHVFAGRMPTAEQSAAAIASETEAFRKRYGFQPMAHRGHNVIWSGWVDHARMLLEHGIRLDGNFCCGAGLQYGYLNGSGQPVRFMDEQGQIIDIYEQATISMEDGWYTEKCFLPAMTMAQCIALSQRQIDQAADYWHSVYHPCFHPIYLQQGERDLEPWIDAVAQHIAHRGLPFVNGSQWVAFNDARRAVRVDAPVWNQAESRLSLSVHAQQPIEGLTLLLPASFAGRVARLGPDMRLVQLEGIEQLAWVLSLAPGEQVTLSVAYTPLSQQ